MLFFYAKRLGLTPYPSPTQCSKLRLHRCTATYKHRVARHGHSPSLLLGSEYWWKFSSPMEHYNLHHFYYSNTQKHNYLAAILSSTRKFLFTKELRTVSRLLSTIISQMPIWKVTSRVTAISFDCLQHLIIRHLLIMWFLCAKDFNPRHCLYSTCRWLVGEDKKDECIESIPSPFLWAKQKWNPYLKISTEYETTETYKLKVIVLF